MLAVILSSWCKDWSWWIKGKETRKDSVWEDVIDGGHLCDQEQWYWERTGKEKHDCAGADYTDDESLSTLGGVKMGCDNLTCFPARYFFFQTYPIIETLLFMQNIESSCQRPFGIVLGMALTLQMKRKWCLFVHLFVEDFALGIDSITPHADISVISNFFCRFYNEQSLSLHLGIL